MVIQLFGHPFSSYTWKAEIAFYENDTPFEMRLLSQDDPATGAEFAALWPVGKFPLLRDGSIPLHMSQSLIRHD